MSKQTTQPNYQKMRYSTDELLTLNGIFAERMDMLLLLRKFMMQGELTETEKEHVKVFTSPNLYPILAKTFLPEIDLTTPIGQLVDMWSNINTKDKDPDEANWEMEARAIIVDYVRGRLNDLRDGTSTGRDFKSLNYSPSKSKYDNYIELSARNTLISHIDFQIGQLWILSGNKKETAQEIEKRLFKDSSK